MDKVNELIIWFIKIQITLKIINFIQYVPCNEK